jgi:hypothetical protein
MPIVQFLLSADGLPFKVVACGIVFLFSAVTAQELGRLLFRRRITKRESGIVGAIAVLCYVLVLLL